MFTAGPSAPPNGVSADGTSTAISVQWGSVPCIHQNGQITSYSVRYGVVGSGNTQTMSVTGNVAMISELETSTNYSVEVAAVNSAGVGEYSDPIIVPTESKIIYYALEIMMSFCHSFSCSCNISDSS